VTGTVVLSGSLGSTSEMWDAQIERLRGGFEVVAVEHPGHGGAPVEEARAMPDLAQRVLDRVSAERFSFVGLSLGGAIGMQIALDAPERLDRLVLACTSARFGPRESWEERAGIVRANGLEALVDVILERWFTPSFRDVRRYREMFLSTDPEGYARCCEAIRDWDVRDEIGAIRRPTLVLSADDDPSAPPDHQLLLAAVIPGARLQTIPDARHLANVERPDLFNAALVSFL
jgi:3-oxoadipate enol-lactonase